MSKNTSLVKIEQGSINKNPISTGLQFFINWIKRILQTNRSPEEIYNFLSTTSKEIFLHTSLYKKTYIKQEDSQLYISDISKVLRDLLAWDPYFMNYTNHPESNIITSSSIVNWIPSHLIKPTHALRFHPVNPEKHYSINGIAITFSLPEKDRNRFLANCIPVNINLIKNGMTDIEEQYQFLLYKDIIVKYHEWLDRFFYDTVSLIKETSIADPNCFDAFNVRKLVWITQQFPLMNKPNLLKQLSQ